MSTVWIPESFRERPYAAAHFARIVQWAQQHLADSTNQPVFSV